MTSLSDDQIKYAKYKWEFLRRNPEYIKDWKNLQNTLKTKYSGIPPLADRKKEQISLCEKWKIVGPLSPDTSYDTLIDTFVPKFVKNFSLEDIGYDRIERLIAFSMHPKCLPGTSFTANMPFIIIDGWDLDKVDLKKEQIILWDKVHCENTRLIPDKLDREFENTPKGIGELIRSHDPSTYVSDKLRKTGKLTVEINLNYSKKRLVDDFKELINGWKVLYEDVQEKRNHAYKKKYHFDNFDDYLKVYDLRQEGMSWSKITTKLKLNSVQTARNHYNAACELIEKGIDLYVK